MTVIAMTSVPPCHPHHQRRVVRRRQLTCPSLSNTGACAQCHWFVHLAQHPVACGRSRHCIFAIRGAAALGSRTVIAMAENVSPQLPPRLLVRVDGMNCAVRDGKKIVAALQALPGMRAAHLLFPSRCVMLEGDGSPDSSSLESSALNRINLAGYSASARAPQWSALSLVGVSCITVARRVVNVLLSHPGVLLARLHFPLRRVLVLSDGDTEGAAAAAAEAGVCARLTLRDVLF